MYRIFEVNYDLRTVPKPKYDALYAELRSFPGWCQVLQSMWFVYTHLTAVEVYNRVCRHLKQSDYTWVNELGEHYGWLPKNVWEWLDKVKKTAGNANARPAPSNPLLNFSAWEESVKLGGKKSGPG